MNNIIHQKCVGVLYSGGVYILLFHADLKTAWEIHGSDFEIGNFFICNYRVTGDPDEDTRSVVVKALCYKAEGRGSETWWGERIF
jgi:hypothetical protein